MQTQASLVITSISAPNGVLKAIAAESLQRGSRFLVIGDVPSPADFALPGCEFYSLTQQKSLDYRFARLCPERHYARKNIGYLLAIQGGAEIIVETDDDNYPLPAFWESRERSLNVPLATQPGWLNVYRYFTDAHIWPRGLPLDEIQASLPPLDSLSPAVIDAPIQQGLANDNPDVDAIYRLLLPLPQNFRDGIRVGLRAGVWCPFNSQNTTWWPDAYPLLYLPAYCSFRMTDIWRSFVAQRIAWENGWSLLFESPTVWQERNDHRLMRDFEEEVPGYLQNRIICDRLGALSLSAGQERLGDNLLICYEELVRHKIIGEAEIPLVQAWLADLADLR